MEDNRETFRTAVQKADATIADMTSGGGVLLPAQQKQFFEIPTPDAVLTNMCTKMLLGAPVEEVDKIGFLSRITRRGNENQALAVTDRSKPDFQKVTFTTVETMCEVHINGRILQDNIQGGSLQSLVNRKMAERFALDWEDLLINGDLTSTDPLLSLLDGILVKALTHAVDNGVHNLCEADFSYALKALPAQFKKNKAAMAFLTSTDGEERWRDVVSNRAGGGGGIADAALVSSNPIPAKGIKVLGIPLFPVNLGTGTNETNILLCDPKNITLGVWQDVTIESQKDIRQNVWIVVGRTRVDVEYMHEPAVAKVVKVLA